MTQNKDRIKDTEKIPNPRDKNPEIKKNPESREKFRDSKNHESRGIAKAENRKNPKFLKVFPGKISKF